jgi:hypothetical protein
MAVATLGLHEFDLLLCDHVRFNFQRQFTFQFAKASARPLTAQLLKYIESQREATIACVLEPKKLKLLLNDGELAQLEAVALDWSSRAAAVMRKKRPPKTANQVRRKPTEAHEMAGGHGFYWIGDPRFGHIAVSCAGEIAEALSTTQSSRWTSESERLGKQVGMSQLDFVDGFLAVKDWIELTRFFLKAVGKKRLLPVPDGECPTPTATVGGKEPPDEHAKLRAEIKKLKTIIADMRRESEDAKPDVIIKAAHFQRSRGRLLLRVLESMGQYNGFGRADPAIKPSRLQQVKDIRSIVQHF